MYQNLEDYVRKLKSDGKVKSVFFRKVRKECMRRGTNISIASLQRYCSLDTTSYNPIVCGVLSEMTGIPVGDLFRVHLDEE